MLSVHIPTFQGKSGFFRREEGLMIFQENINKMLLNLYSFFGFISILIFPVLDVGCLDWQDVEDPDRGVRRSCQLGVQQGYGTRVLQVLYMGDCSSNYQVKCLIPNICYKKFYPYKLVFAMLRDLPDPGSITLKNRSKSWPLYVKKWIRILGQLR